MSLIHPPPPVLRYVPPTVQTLPYIPPMSHPTSNIGTILLSNEKAKMAGVPVGPLIMLVELIVGYTKALTIKFCMSTIIHDNGGTNSETHQYT
mmetsp:Transcript_32469/g.37589  ORF Transcript_32469/g.37589 Transcript_32469/m.37589 type:complete len:93 (+) Transcript_32469:40-318(+)